MTEDTAVKTEDTAVAVDDMDVDDAAAGVYLQTDAHTAAVLNMNNPKVDQHRLVYVRIILVKNNPNCTQES